MNSAKFAAAALGLLVLASTAEARDFSGSASWYQHGARTASGERFNPDGLTAAHRSLPFGTPPKVTNLRTGRSVHVRVNDRGPSTQGSVLAVSRAPARHPGMTGSVPAQVKVELTSN